MIASRIATRAISADPAVVTEVAGLYCATLMTDRRALHAEAFPRSRPRLRGHAQGHRRPRRAAASELEASDWLPFRQLMADGTAFTMLGHARLTAHRRATGRPRSRERSSKDLLRDTWKHDGILITDDFSMGAVTLEPRGRRAGGAIAALNAGVDLILVSYDPDQYFPMMYALLRGRSRRRACARTALAAERRAAAPRRGTLGRHQFAQISRANDAVAASPQSLTRPLKSLLLPHFAATHQGLG